MSTSHVLNHPTLAMDYAEHTLHLFLSHSLCRTRHVRAILTRPRKQIETEPKTENIHAVQNPAWYHDCIAAALIGRCLHGGRGLMTWMLCVACVVVG